MFKHTTQISTMFTDINNISSDKVRFINSQFKHTHSGTQMSLMLVILDPGGVEVESSLCTVQVLPEEHMAI